MCATKQLIIFTEIPTNNRDPKCHNGCGCYFHANTRVGETTYAFLAKVGCHRNLPD